MLDALSDGRHVVVRWWDGVELWLTQLPLAIQVALLMLVLLPACWAVAKLIDRVVDAVSERVGHRSETGEDG
ncbi:MAG: hypothetical protein GEU83_15570 [Pseudonocardiaceae bacterium]|nr:hypothetical protein [Pseudonocardiaceae bacterium]